MYQTLSNAIEVCLIRSISPGQGVCVWLNQLGSDLKLKKILFIDLAMYIYVRMDAAN